MTANARGFALGYLAIVAIAAAAFFGMASGMDSGPFIWISQIVGGVIAARLASTRKLLVASALAIPAAISLALVNWAWDTFGYGSDFQGFSGSITLMGISLAIGACLCFVGGLLGVLLSRLSRAAQY